MGGGGGVLLVPTVVVDTVLWLLRVLAAPRGPAHWRCRWCGPGLVAVCGCRLSCPAGGSVEREAGPPAKDAAEGLRSHARSRVQQTDPAEPASLCTAALCGPCRCLSPCAGFVQHYPDWVASKWQKDTRKWVYCTQVMGGEGIGGVHQPPRGCLRDSAGRCRTRGITVFRRRGPRAMGQGSSWHARGGD